MNERPTWDAAELKALLATIAMSAPAVEIEWHLAPGEGWATIWSESEVCGLVRTPTTANRAVRFAFVQEGAAVMARPAATLKGAGAEVVQLADFDAVMLSISPEDLADFIDGEVPPTAALDPKGFAANDLVFVSL